MTKEEIFKKIDDYNLKFYTKVKNENEKSELITAWYKNLEKELAFCLAMKDEKYWNKLFLELEDMLESSNLYVKQVLIEDVALENLHDLLIEVEGIDFKKCLDSTITINVEKYNSYKEQIDNYMEVVREFNLEQAREYKKEILSNLEYLITGDIEKASDKVKDYYNYVLSKNGTKSK